jgi:hypothetical protein
MAAVWTSEVVTAEQRKFNVKALELWIMTDIWRIRSSNSLYNVKQYDSRKQSLINGI